MLSNFISLKYFSKRKINNLITLTARIKKNPQKFKRVLNDFTIGLLFQKPSLRTKTAFYLGALQLGARAIYFSPQEVQMGEREATFDVARTLARYLDCVVLRCFSHQTILDFVKASTIPVVNGLSDFLHPSQVLGDLFTLHEVKKDIRRIKVVFIGDGNNVCHSLLYGFSIIGGNLVVATPENYSPNREVVQEVKDFAKVSGAKIEVLHDPIKAAEDSDVVYTDVWVSMGKEKESSKRIKAFKKFQVNDKILKKAKKTCVIMHCLPARRGQEITSKVLDSKNSIIFLQAENRLHSAKAILVYLLNKKFSQD
ncbi:MAG: ornithine carbamoyltransferase [Candidatus Omnitrophota bacterium]|nr:MAG: ornithine carbamoyltransferase [Candidatus Omnitrophota bacterium]HDN86580.1 ornithine carbamoyltransferase [Candidatus Omnitrophota bacterium]